MFNDFSNDIPEVLNDLSDIEYIKILKNKHYKLMDREINEKEIEWIKNILKERYISGGTLRKTKLLPVMKFFKISTKY